ncbi:MAG: helix-turn-helix transcriptional regulator [Candidatus Eisenbacteria bacterium]|nr:helix-turn-helix transcriptional regulator [Candidatus Eisenbacteria bacterium]
MIQKRTPKKQSFRRTRDALQILDHDIGDDQELRRDIAQETLNARVAMMIHDARTAARLTQAQLAGLIGSKQSVIARLEDADYEGHSLTMLQRIAAALNARLDVRLIPEPRPRAVRSGRHD